MAEQVDPPSDPVRCTKCLKLAGRFLSPVSHLTHQNFFECQACRHVWSEPPTPPPAPPQPDDISA
jgi:hypothetical protein